MKCLHIPYCSFMHVSFFFVFFCKSIHAGIKFCKRHVSGADVHAYMTSEPRTVPLSGIPASLLVREFRIHIKGTLADVLKS